MIFMIDTKFIITIDYHPLTYTYKVDLSKLYLTGDRLPVSLSAETSRSFLNNAIARAIEEPRENVIADFFLITTTGNL